MHGNSLRKLWSKDTLDEFSLLRILINSLPEQVYLNDRENRYVVDNAAHARALGAAGPEEVAGRRDSDFYPEELATRYRAEDREVILSGRPLIGKEEPSIDEEGNERWCSTIKVPLRDGDGNILGS